MIRTIALSEIQIDAGSTQMAFELPRMPAGRYGFHFLFDANAYPLERHLCYMQPQNQQSLENQAFLRFAEMDFKPSPPGIAVGPWPGWRGIPEMPSIRLKINDQDAVGKYNFWGDERYTHKVRVIIIISIDVDKKTSARLKWTDERLRPRLVTIMASPRPRIRATNALQIKQFEPAYPRLLFSANDLAELRQRALTTHRPLWNIIRELLGNWELPFKLTPESKTLPGPERLNDPDRVLLTAFVALITSNRTDIRKAHQALDTYLDLALQPDYEPMNIDTQAGEGLFTACLAYDWLWQFSPADWRDQQREKLNNMAEKVWAHLGYYREDYGQAHFLGCSHGLLAFSFLFWNEHPRAKEWAAYFYTVFSEVQRMFPVDGFYPHGTNLWIYEHTFLLRYLELIRHCTGKDFWNATPYWKNASHFRAASLSPDLQCGITFGDPQYRVAGDAWMHYLIAQRTHSPAAQALALKLADQSPVGVDFRSVPPRRCIWEFLYFDPALPPTLFQHKTAAFPDGGQFFWREETERHKNLITFRAGAPLGNQRYAWGEWSGYGHSDPNQGSFLIYQNQFFMACGPGPVYRRETALHNTLTFDGYGQIGDRQTWAPDFVPANCFASITGHHLNDDIEWIEADLAPCYLPFLQIKQLVRRMTFIRPFRLEIRDQIELAKHREIQWNLHSLGTFKHQPESSGYQFEINKGPQILGIQVLQPRQFEWRTGLSTFVPAYPHSGERDRFLQISCHGEQIEFLIRIELE